MRVTPAGIALIHEWEELRLEAYDDNGAKPGGTWTIGWGTIKYPRWHLEGRRVQRGDICTADQADRFFAEDLRDTEQRVDMLTRDDLLPRQFDALCSLTYNIGSGNYSQSTVRRLVNMSPGNSAIREAFRRWHYQEGKPVYGLWRRRHREADFYFGVETPEPEYPHPRRIA